MATTDRARGRPRSEAAHEAALKSAYELLCERGFEAMSLEAVADRAGIGKTTLYRHWTGRAALAVDAFFAGTKNDLVFPDTGTAREDFRQQIHALAGVLRGSAGAAMAAMVAGARFDPELARALGERWVAPRKAWGVARMQRAIDEGECPADLDIDAALSTFYSPLYAPMLFGRGILHDAEIDAYLAIAFRGVFTHRPRSPV